MSHGTTDEKKRGPRLVAWWRDSHGKMFQFVQQDDYFALRSRESVDQDWLYSGTWIAETNEYGTTNKNQ